MWQKSVGSKSVQGEDGNLHLAMMSTPTEHKEHQKRNKMQKSEIKRIVDTTAFSPNLNISLSINFARLRKLSRIWTMAHAWKHKQQVLVIKRD